MQCPECQAANPETSRFCAECGTKLTPLEKTSAPPTKTIVISLEALTTGSTFAGRYQVIEELGKGGMGKVYKVFDTKVNEKVALKLIRPEVSSDRETIERFRNELRLARKISHRHVCRMFDLGEAEGAHFITMEYVPGEDLKSMIRMTGGLRVGAILGIGKQVCEGLTEAHSLGVVHRDLKPQNIMIDKGGSVKIMDFGIARFLRERGITGAQVMIGTPEYMSPEQAEAKEVDERSDIYSLGVVLYEMATGRVPFEGETPLSVAIKHKGEMPKAPREFNSDIPDDLNRLILKCLEKDKGKRYQSATEVRAELEKIERGIPIFERVVPGTKPVTSKEITIKFPLKKLIIPGIALVAVVACGLIYLLFAPKKPEQQGVGAKQSIAVLPFIDLSPAKDQEYLCDGIAETLINALSSVKGLRVPARTSAFFFKGKDVDIKDIGRKLSVETVLEGSVQVAGEKLRVTGRLSNASDGYQLWSETYERSLGDIFAIQDEIAQAIVNALKIKVMGEKEKPLVKPYTENREAYELYLKGRYFWNKRGKDNLYKALEYFQQALDKDPTYALAYAGLADTYSILGNNFHLRPEDAYPKAKAAALKALEIESSLAEAISTLASIKRDYEWDFIKAEMEYKKAIEINPGYAYAHQGCAFLLTDLSRHEEAIAEVKVARELDPLAPRISANVGLVLYYARKYDQALAELRKALELDPYHAVIYLYLGDIYEALGNYDKAISFHQKCIELSGESSGEGMESQLATAYIYGVSGRKEDARKMLAKIEAQAKDTYVPPVLVASVFCGLGEKDRAFTWLEKAFIERDNRICYLNVDPKFDALRSDPRFTALLKRIGLEK